MTTSETQLKKIAEGLHALANLIDDLAPALARVDSSELREAAVETVAEETEKAAEETAKEEVKHILPVEEAFIETAAETGEVIPPAKVYSAAEVRDIATKAIKAGFRSKVKEAISKYGESISEIGEKSPESLGLLFKELTGIMEEADA